MSSHDDALFSLSSVPDHDGRHSLHIQSAGVDFDDSGYHRLHR